MIGSEKPPAELPPDTPYPEYSTLNPDSPRVVVSAANFPVDLPEDSTAEIDWKTGKVGNMSPRYGEDAHNNLVQFLEGSGIDPRDVVIMKPQMNGQEPVGIVDAADVPRGDSYTRSDVAATMIYSHDKDRALAVLTGDSPFMAGHGVDNEGRHVQFLIHLGWRVEEAGYVRESLEYTRDHLGLNLAETNFVITPGAEKLDFTKRGEEPDERFTNENWTGNIRPVPEEDAQPDQERFRVSMAGFATNLLHDLGAEAGQIFVDGSDVTDERTPYSSDRKAKASGGEIPTTRDAVVVTMPDYPSYNETQAKLRTRRSLTLAKKAVQS